MNNPSPSNQSSLSSPNKSLSPLNNQSLLNSPSPFQNEIQDQTSLNSPSPSIQSSENDQSSSEFQVWKMMKLMQLKLTSKK